jgi:DNA-binding transcriptional ArsR family regulator
MTQTMATVQKDSATQSVSAATSARQTAQRLAPVLKALSDEHRLAILLTLAEGPRSVVQLTAELEMSQTLVSHHLKALRECHLVSITPKGRSNVYSMCCNAVAEPVRYLAGIAVSAQTANEQGA